MSAMVRNLNARAEPADIRVVAIDSFNHWDVTQGAAGLAGALAAAYRLPAGAASAVADVARSRGTQRNRSDEVGRLAREAQVVVIGLGSFQAGQLPEALAFQEQVLSEKERGEAVGDVRYRFLRADGTTVGERSLSFLTADQLMYKSTKGDVTLAVASGDPKVKIIRAALLGKYVNTLVTDERTARAVIASDEAA